MKRLVAVFVVGTVALVVVAGVWLFGAGSSQPSTGVTAVPFEDAAPAGAQEFVLTGDTVASFALDEELRGSPQTVVGTSDRVVGRIRVDPADPATAQIGEITVDARAFTTDSALRDRAIRGRILDTDAFEFVTFRPERIEGLDGPVTPGGEVSFTVSGDLTIRDVTRPVTFEVAVTFDGERLTGEAVAQVSRSDFGLVIPSVRGVANVTDQVEIALDFVAEPA